MVGVLTLIRIQSLITTLHVQDPNTKGAAHITRALHVQHWRALTAHPGKAALELTAYPSIVVNKRVAQYWGSAPHAQACKGIRVRGHKAVRVRGHNDITL